MLLTTYVVAHAVSLQNVLTKNCSGKTLDRHVSHHVLPPPCFNTIGPEEDVVFDWTLFRAPLVRVGPYCDGTFSGNDPTSLVEFAQR